MAESAESKKMLLEQYLPQPELVVPERARVSIPAKPLPAEFLLRLIDPQPGQVGDLSSLFGCIEVPDYAQTLEAARAIG